MRDWGLGRLYFLSWGKMPFCLADNNPPPNTKILPNGTGDHSAAVASADLLPLVVSCGSS